MRFLMVCYQLCVSIYFSSRVITHHLQSERYMDEIYLFQFKSYNTSFTKLEICMRFVMVCHQLCVSIYFSSRVITHHLQS